MLNIDFVNDDQINYIITSQELPYHVPIYYTDIGLTAALPYSHYHAIQYALTKDHHRHHRLLKVIARG